MRKIVFIIGFLTFTVLHTSVYAVHPHPYLYCTPDNISVLKTKIQQDTLFKDAWTKMQADADKFVKDEKAGLNRLEVLGLAYCMTGQADYANKAKVILLAESKKDNWYDKMMLNRTPPWYSDLGTAGKCYDMAVGFDCVYDVLTEQERKTIAQALVRLGIQPILNDWVTGPNRIHSLDTMGHNWWSACVFMAGVASMAVMNEEPAAAGWLQTISDGSLEWFDFAGSVLSNKPCSFDPAGGFYESVNYAAFGMSEYMLFRVAWLNAMDVKPPQIPILNKIGDFFIQTCYPSSTRLMSVNFGDTSIHAHGARPVMLSMACGDKRDRYFWYLNETGQSQFKEGADLSSPTGLLFRPSLQADKLQGNMPDLPNSVLMESMGWAILRSSWKKDAAMLAVKSGFTWNHAHADAGSFILFHQGQYLLIDSGNCNYTLPEYTGYYSLSQAHNVVLFNGQAQNPEDAYYGVNTPGSLHNLIDTGDFKYLYADATGPTSQYFSRNYRHFLWIGDVILIIDDLKSHTAGQFEWLLHYEGSARRNGLDIEVSQEQAKVLVRPLFPQTFPAGGFTHDFPEKMRLVEKTGLKDHDVKTQVPYYAITHPDVSRQTKFITAVVLVNDRNKDSLPQLTRLQGKDMIGVRINDGKNTTDAYFNLLADGRIKHRNSVNTLDGWETDALILAASYPSESGLKDNAQAARLFMSNGSYLRRNGTILMDSLSKVFVVAEQSDSGLNVVLQGQPRINLAFHTPQKPGTVMLNGKSVTPAYDAQNQKMTLSNVVQASVLEVR
jgi:hypothetical protein